MNLRAFADEVGELHLEISSPSLVYRRKLFVPMLASSAPILEGADSRTLIDVSYEGSQYKVPYLLVHSEETRWRNWKEVGHLEDNDSRNVLNHIVDILAWD